MNGPSPGGYNLWQLVVVALLAGSGGSLGLRTLIPPRPDAFTGNEARALQGVVLAELDRQNRLQSDRLELQLQQLEHRIRVDMPPAPTRLRLEALEDAVRELMRDKGRDWSPPSIHFAKRRWIPKGREEFE